LSRLRGAWEAAWFGPEAPTNLAAARVVLALQALWILLSRDLPALSALPPEFFAAVTDSARWRYLLWEGHPVLERGLQSAALLALAGALAGIAPRACCAAAGLLLYHLAPLEALFYTPSPWAKGLTGPVLGLLTLSLAPCGDALAVRVPRRPRAPWEYGWALRLVQLFVAQAYLFSGWAKLVQAGPAWAGAANIRAWLLLSNQDEQLAVFSGPGLFVADRPALALAMGVAALAFDLIFVAAVFFPRSRRVLVPAAVLFHAGVLVTQNYAFLSAPLLLLFVDWDAIRNRSATLRAAAATSSRLSPSSLQRTPTSFTRMPAARARASTSTSNM
jgi:hypothetical protein